MKYNSRTSQIALLSSILYQSSNKTKSFPNTPTLIHKLIEFLMHIALRWWNYLWSDQSHQFMNIFHFFFFFFFFFKKRNETSGVGRARKYITKSVKLYNNCRISSSEKIINIVSLRIIWKFLILNRFGGVQIRKWYFLWGGEISPHTARKRVNFCFFTFLFFFFFKCNL